MKNYICGANKFAYGKGYIYLPIDLDSNLPDDLEIDGVRLLRKSSFHVSLVCVKNIGNNLEQKVIDSFCKFTSVNDISFVRFIGEFRFAEFEERKTLVVKCQISGIEKFIKQLSQELGMDIPNQPTHVTLYTLQPDAGIGLNSLNELDGKSKVVEGPIKLDILSLT